MESAVHLTTWFVHFAKSKSSRSQIRDWVFARIATSHNQRQNAILNGP